MNARPWYEINGVDSIDSPALIIYTDRVEENIRSAIALAGEAGRLRPHVKTNKSKEACMMMMQQGIAKFKCATISEAEMLALCNAENVLLAYQPSGPKLARFIALKKAYPVVKFSCLIDNAQAATAISSAATNNNVVIDFYIDINVGMNRTGIAPENAIDLYDYCLTLSNIHPIGLHVYDGHIHDLDMEIRRTRCNLLFDSIERLKQSMIQRGFQAPVVIAGGSPTFPIHAERKDVECSPGTFIYWDRNYQLACAEQPFKPAVLVMTRVVSIPQQGKLCLDVGHKSIASENDIHHRISFLNDPELKCISHSEEHLLVEAKSAHNYEVGDVLYGLPFHVCPTAALYECAVTVANNRPTGEWKMIARDRKINF